MAKLNPIIPDVSDMFCGLICAASGIFVNHLMYGGGFETTAHGEELSEHLLAIMELIEPYDAKDIYVYTNKIEVKWQQPWKKSHGSMLFVRLMKLISIGFSRGAMKATNPSKSFLKNFMTLSKAILVAFGKQESKQRG